MKLSRRPARVTDELQPIRDAVCLDAYNDLMPVQAIAEACGKSRITIWRWIKRARNNPRPPNLAIWANDSGSTCRHGRPIIPGMAVLCIECWQTGIPNHPDLRWGRIGASTGTINDSPAEIAAAVQPRGAAKFQPNIKAPKTITASPEKKSTATGSTDPAPGSSSP